MCRPFYKLTFSFFSVSSLVCVLLFTKLQTVNAQSVNAQTQAELAPGTEVLLFRISTGEKSATNKPTANKSKKSEAVKLDFIANISQADGYDNQPSFSPDSKKVLFVSARDGKQMDIYQYSIANKSLTQLTNTPENEFSPMLEKDGKNFTAVREGGNPYQSVHRYSYLPKGEAATDSQWAVSSQTPIGYYAFDNKGVAVGWARWANAIYIFEPNNQYATFATGHALPSKPYLIPQSELFSFVHRQADDQSWIKSLDPKTRAITPIAPIFKKNIDYNWMPDGRLISAKDSELHVWSKQEQSWKFFANLSEDKVFEISRLAVSPDGKYLAVVARVPK